MKNPITRSLALFLSFVALASAETSKPNIIVIYTDDQGYGDVSALNPEAKFQTPHMDRLAKEGIAFTNGHSADSVCTPSRYALLTGRYPWRTTRKEGVLGSEATCMIPDERMTLASLLKENGYNTAMVGKWHLGMDFPGTKENRDWSQPVKDMPLDKGFDYYFGIPASLNFGILAWFEGRHAKVPPTLRTAKKKNPRSSDYRIMPPYDEAEGKVKKSGLEVAPDFIDNECLTRFTDKAIEWMASKAEEAKAGKPFFLYLPYTSPHYPVCPLPEFHGKGAAGAYGEFMIETDHRVGQILAFLEKSGLDENTLIVFSSDNGPESSWPARRREFGHHGMSHHKEQKQLVDQYILVRRWYASQFSYLLERMKSVDEGDGTLLDNSIVLYGSGMKDGNGHIKDNLPILVAGKGGGKFKPGRHIACKNGTPLANLHQSIEEKFEIYDQVESFNGVGTGMIGI